MARARSSVSPPTPSPGSSTHHRLAAALLVIAITVVYWPTLSAPFIFDDLAAILHNPTIRHGVSVAAFSPPTEGGTTTGRPLVNFSFAVNYAISGENPWSYHALNLAIHALAALALFGLVRVTLSRAHAGALAARDRPSSPLTAFAVALLWSLHPLLTESVACAAQRTESLCGLLYLLTLYTFARSPDSPRWLALSVIAGLCGTATKEVMVTAPLVVLLYDRTFVSGTFSTALRTRRSYYAALAGTWLVLAGLLVSGGGSRGVAAGFGLGLSPWRYLLTQCEALVLYLRLAVWPHPLVLDYGTTVARSLAEVWWQAGIVLSLLAGTVWALVRKPRIGFLGASFFLLLAPSSSFVPLVTQTIAEHRMYLPLATVLIGLAFLSQRLLGPSAMSILALVAITGGGFAFARNRDYGSEIAIWQDNVAHHPHARVLTALGVALLHAGRPAEALPYFSRALTLDPSHLAAQRNRALALLQLGQAAEAGAILATLPAREAGEAEEYYALGNAFAREQKFAEAAAAYTRTVALDPAHAAAHANLGNALLLQGRARDAIAEYETVLRLNPNDTRTRENLQAARDALR